MFLPSSSKDTKMLFMTVSKLKLPSAIKMARRTSDKVFPNKLKSVLILYVPDHLNILFPITFMPTFTYFKILSVNLV